MKCTTWLGLISCAFLAGCTSGWIENPSPSTRALVNDLRLEGFECSAGFSEVECIEIEPVKSKQSAKCDSQRGCIEQPDLLIYNRYRITQQDSGMPSMKLDVVQVIDQKKSPEKKTAQPD